MTLSQRRHTGLRRLALLCSVLVLAITSLSAFIRLSNVGLGCSDWPQCYGARLHAAQQGLAPTPVDSDAVLAARLAHRVVAVLALLLVIAMVVVFFELWAIAWIQNRFMETPFLRAALQVVVGGALVFAAGALIGGG